MTQELLYTSAPRGLKPGSSGFCTVASTRGMAAPLAAALESLSAYRHVFRPGDPQSHRNPVTFSHVKLNAGGRTYSVLSRVADYGQDYSGRTNKLAHHVALQTSEFVSGGPAHLLAQPRFMESNWDGDPCILPVGRPAKQTRPASLGVCRNWQDMTGDAGWAGVLAEAYLKDPQRAVYIVFEPGMDLLPLISEAICLLPENRRWDVTFSTYFTTLPRSATCHWRCVLAGSKEANESRRFVQALRIDLTEPLERATGGALVDQARSGQRARPTSPPVPSAAVSADIEYFEVVNSGQPDEELPAAANEPVGMYGLTGPSSVPPPPPRRRRDFDTDGHEISGRKIKLAAMAAVLLTMVGTIVVVVVILPSDKSRPEEESVAKAEGDGGKQNNVSSETENLADSNVPEKVKPPPHERAAMADEDGTLEDGHTGREEQAETSGPDETPKAIPDPDTKTTSNNENKGGGDANPSSTNTPGSTGTPGERRNVPEVAPKSTISSNAVADKRFQEISLIQLTNENPVRDEKNSKFYHLDFIDVKSDEAAPTEPPTFRLAIHFPTALSHRMESQLSSDGTVLHVYDTTNTKVEIGDFHVEYYRFGERFELLIALNARQKQRFRTLLPWCVLEVQNDESEFIRRYVLHKRVANPAMPQLTDGSCVWRISPRTDRDQLDFTARVKLVFKSITLESNGESLTFTSGSTDKASDDAGSVTSDDARNYLVGHFFDKANEGHKSTFRPKTLTLKATPEKGGQDLKIVLIPSRVKSCWDAATDLFEAYANLALKPFPAPNAPNRYLLKHFSGPIEIVSKAIQNTDSELGKLKMKPKDNADEIKNKTQLREVLSELQNVASTMQSRYDALPNAKITAAHIYYEVKTDDKQPLKIDVIKFGEPPQPDDEQKP